MTSGGLQKALEEHRCPSRRLSGLQEPPEGYPEASRNFQKGIEGLLEGSLASRSLKEDTQKPPEASRSA